MVDLKAQLARIRPEVDAAVERVITSAQFIQGEDCHRLEQEFAAWCGASHACAVANGTDALILALRAYGVGPGDAVVTVANTFIATGEAILLNGAKPVFVDVDPATSTAIPPTWTGSTRSPAGTACPCSRTRPRPTGPRSAAAERGASATPPASASIRARTSGPTATRGW